MFSDTASTAKAAMNRRTSENGGRKLLRGKASTDRQKAVLQQKGHASYVPRNEIANEA